MVKFAGKIKQTNITPYVNLRSMGNYMLKDLIIWLIFSGLFHGTSKKSRERERWRRNRTGRSLSPSQIPQKNISMPSKLHKTNSVGWQRTSGNQKSRPFSSKTGREKYKRQKRRQRRWGGSSVPGREACPGKGILRREVSKPQETLSLPSQWRALETQRATQQEGKLDK